LGTRIGPKIKKKREKIDGEITRRTRKSGLVAVVYTVERANETERGRAGEVEERGTSARPGKGTHK